MIEVQDDIIEPNTAWVMTSSTTTTSNTPVMSPFTELDDEHLIDEEEIQQLHQELDQLKIVIGRLKPSGIWCFLSSNRLSFSRTGLEIFYCRDGRNNSA